MSHWEEENEEEDEDSEMKSNDDHIIFLVDCRKAMYEKNSKGEIIIINVLKMLLSVLKSKIIASDKTCIGAICFGCGHKSADSTVDYLNILLSLDVPSAKRIKKIQHLIDNVEELYAEIGSQEDAMKLKGLEVTPKTYIPVKEAIWECSNEYNKKSHNFKDIDFKRVWLFTCDDNPNCKLPAEQVKIIQVAQDMAETNIEISLFHMNKYNAITNSFHEFNIDIFYNKILVVDEEGDVLDRTVSGGDDGFDALMDRIKKKMFKKRRMGSLMFYMGGVEDPPTGLDETTAETNNSANTSNSKVTLSLHYYKTLNVTKKPNITVLYAQTNQKVITISKYIDGTTGEVLDTAREGDISTYIDVQGDRIPFTKTEVQDIINNKVVTWCNRSEALTGSVRLLYFTPLSNLQPVLNISTPYFLFPDDLSIKGSKLIFTGLVDDLAQKQLVGIAMYLRNKSSSPRMVALVPQIEGDSESFTASATGLYMIPLPYAGEIRSVFTGGTGAHMPVQAIPDDMYNTVNKLINAQQLESDSFTTTSQMKNNPVIQRFYSTLQAIALNETHESKPVVDDIYPDEAVQEQNADIYKEFKDVFQLDTCETHIPTKKRAAPTDKAAPSAKKTKVAGDDNSNNDYAALIQAGNLKKETVATLKAICSWLNCPVSGKKDDLIERINTTYNK